MKGIIARVLLLSVLLAGYATNIEPTDAVASGDIPFFTIQELKAKLGEPSLAILDVRIPKHIAASRQKIRGAIWVNPKEFDRWIQSFAPDATYVLY